MLCINLQKCIFVCYSVAILSNKGMNKNKKKTSVSGINDVSVFLGCGSALDEAPVARQRLEGVDVQFGARELITRDTTPPVQ